jgi:hypothetical protein
MWSPWTQARHPRSIFQDRGNRGGLHFTRIFGLRIFALLDFLRIGFELVTGRVTPQGTVTRTMLELAEFPDSLVARTR